MPDSMTAGPGLAELRWLSGLTYLSLKDAKLRPDSLKHIGQLEQLETLGLDQTNVTGPENVEEFSTPNEQRIAARIATSVNRSASHSKSWPDAPLLALVPALPAPVFPGLTPGLPRMARQPLPRENHVASWSGL